MDSAKGSPEKALHLWSDAPRFEISTAPLTDKDGQALQLPDSFHGDHALFLSDQQVCCPLHLQVMQAALSKLHATKLQQNATKCKIACNKMQQRGDLDPFCANRFISVSCFPGHVWPLSRAYNPPKYMSC